ncbi:protein SERAC1 [Marchantia polymorpha subsp. ruderalis]|uniref:DUF676 domain-containing protein n=2 Tax=Marchantia polymorpha TaxID=3197 RepID=A0AAF6BA58_MARPO|nr:hypothetical protein MARPO_0119s0056 [Marchantia polymorpha]BBN08892.1 hypothetical protein Mp_4g15320 [Marchantia polymorpha subsp. ruderalis]|eukprot:PTQ30858.1 hypothetical protein MARPO_0119s0056 [Marchantia polymorpha]
MEHNGEPRVRKINDNVYEFCNPDNPSVEIIFVHGIQMGNEDVSKPHLSTWKVKSEKADAPTEYWPQTFFAKDEHLTSKNISVRALTACYDAAKDRTDNRGRLDIYNIAENFVNSMIGSDRVCVGQRAGVPVIMVGHSFGGLLIMELVDHISKKARQNGSAYKNLPKFLNNLKGFFFYSTPHLALQDAVVQRLFPSGDNVPVVRTYNALTTLFKQLNKDVARLHEGMTKYAANHGIEVSGAFESNETDLGDNLEPIKIVTEASAGCGAGTLSAIREDHFNVCRPTDVQSSNYQALADFVVRIVNREKEEHSDAAGLDLPEVCSFVREEGGTESGREAEREESDRSELWGSAF